MEIQFYLMILDSRTGELFGKEIVMDDGTPDDEPVKVELGKLVFKIDVEMKGE